MSFKINNSCSDFDVFQKTDIKKNGFKQSFFDIFNKQVSGDSNPVGFVEINLMGFRSFFNNRNIDELSCEDFPDLLEGLKSMVERMSLLIQIINDKQKNDVRDVENKAFLEPLKIHNTAIHEFNGQLDQSIEKYTKLSSEGSDLIKRVNDKVDDIEQNIIKKQIIINDKCLKTLYWLSETYNIYHLDKNLIEKTLKKHEENVSEQNERVREFKDFRDVTEVRLKIATDSMKKKFPENFSSEEENQELVIVKEGVNKVGEENEIQNKILKSTNKNKRLRDFLKKIKVKI